MASEYKYRDRLSIQVPMDEQELIKEFREHCAAHGYNMSEVIRGRIREWLQSKREPQPADNALPSPDVSRYMARFHTQGGSCSCKLCVFGGA